MLFLNLARHESFQKDDRMRSTEAKQNPLTVPAVQVSLMGKLYILKKSLFNLSRISFICKLGPHNN